MKSISVFIVSLSVLVAVQSTVPQYRCPPSAVQLISSQNVIDSNVLHGENFFEVVNVSHIYNVFFWEPRPENTLPNQGNLTFNETYVLLGLTTAGDSLSNGNQFFVSNFSLRYSESLNGSFTAYPEYFTVDSADETIFYFDEPIVFQRLQITIHNARNDYGLRLVLIGCLLGNAVVPSVTDQQVLPTESNQPFTISSEMYSKTDIVLSSSSTSNMCSTSSSHSTLSVHSSTYLTSLRSSSTVTLDMQIANNCSSYHVAVIALGTLVLFLLVVIIVLVVSLVVIGYRYRNKNIKYYIGDQHRKNSLTSNALPNISIYSGNNEDEFISNASYLSSSTDYQYDTVYYEAYIEPTLKANNVYTEVDDNERAASSSGIIVYDYESVKSSAKDTYNMVNNPSYGFS